MRADLRGRAMRGPVINPLHKLDLALMSVIRLIGFEELGHNDQFSAKALEFRLKQSGESRLLAKTDGGLPAGALPSGPLTLGDHVSSALLADRDSDDDHSSDDERDQGGRSRGQARRGKTGIRDGFASRGMGEDE